MAHQGIVAVVAGQLAAYLPPGAAEAECTIPIATIDGWLVATGAAPLPPDARDPGWWADLRSLHDYPALPAAGWRVERIDWEGAGVTFGWDDGAHRSDHN
jgi:hypothetical protein